jgi:hypothetical protein
LLHIGNQVGLATPVVAHPNQINNEHVSISYGSDCSRGKFLARQRQRAAVVVLAFEVAAGERQLCQRLALVVANDQRVVFECPFTAGEEIAGTAALGRDGALTGAGRVAERHEAAAARSRGEAPPPGQIDRRWRRRRRGGRWRRRSRDRRWFGFWRAGAGGERGQHEQSRGRLRAVLAPNPHTRRTGHQPFRPSDNRPEAGRN